MTSRRGALSRSLRRLVRLAPALALFALAEARADAPARVATLLPYVADALGLMPQPRLVVASVRSEATKPPPGGVIDLGSAHAPNLERLLEARPTVIVADGVFQAAHLERLRATGVEVALVSSESVDATFAGLVDVASRVGQREAMEHEVARARSSLASSTLSRRVRLLPLFGTPGGFFVITSQAWLGDLASRLGFENVAATATGSSRIPGYVELSDETVAGLSPELVVLVTHGDQTAVRSAFVRRYAARGLLSAAAAEERVRVVGPPLFGANPGLALSEAGRVLVALARSGPVASSPPSTPAKAPASIGNAPLGPGER